MNYEDLFKQAVPPSFTHTATEDRRFRRVAGLEDGLEKLAASIVLLACATFVGCVLISLAIHYHN